MEARPLEMPKQARGSLRRGVEIPVELSSSYWDGKLTLVSSDLSGSGVFVECPLPLEVGDEVEVRFLAPSISLPFELSGRVHRVSLPRRRGDAGRSGMGIAFTEMSATTREILEYLLEGLPPRLPRRRAPSMRN